MKTLRRGLRAPDREKVKACSLECPSDIREDVCSVSRIPSSVSGCQGSAGGFPPRRPRERRKEILYRVSCWLSTTFFKIFENSFPTGTRRHWPRGPAAAPSSSADLVEYPFGSKSARGNLENSLNDIYATLATRATRKLPLACHAKPPSQHIKSRRSQEFLSDRMSAL